jgi:hypothetical protein
MKGPYAGTQRAVLRLIPKGAQREAGRDDKRTPESNSAVGGASDSDHLTTNELAYAADIPPDAETYAKLRKDLGLPPAATGNDSVTKDGYRYQLIFGAEHGHGDHIHLGARWTGGGDVSASAGSYGLGGTTTPAASGIPSSGPGSASNGQETPQEAALRRLWKVDYVNDPPKPYLEQVTGEPADPRLPEEATGDYGLPTSVDTEALRRRLEEKYATL